LRVIHAFFEGKKAGQAYARKSGPGTLKVGSPTVVHDLAITTAYEKSLAIFSRVSPRF
jgi:hypothetical protein